VFYRLTGIDKNPDRGIDGLTFPDNSRYLDKKKSNRRKTRQLDCLLSLTGVLRVFAPISIKGYAADMSDD